MDVGPASYEATSSNDADRQSAGGPSMSPRAIDALHALCVTLTTAHRHREAAQHWRLLIRAHEESLWRDPGGSVRSV